LRSILAAATTNLDYLRTMSGLSGDAAEIARETGNFVRMSADIIEFSSAIFKGGNRPLDLDIRVCVWVSRDPEHNIFVDGGCDPYIVRMRLAEMASLVAMIQSCVAPDVPATLATNKDMASIAPLSEHRFAIADAINQKGWSICASANAPNHALQILRSETYVFPASDGAIPVG
jgi:hypothetical protein